MWRGHPCCAYHGRGIDGKFFFPSGGCWYASRRPLGLPYACDVLHPQKPKGQSNLIVCSKTLHAPSRQANTTLSCCYCCSTLTPPSRLRCCYSPRYTHHLPPFCSHRCSRLTSVLTVTLPPIEVTQPTLLTRQLATHRAWSPYTQHFLNLPGLIVVSLVVDRPKKKRFCNITRAFRTKHHTQPGHVEPCTAGSVFHPNATMIPRNRLGRSQWLWAGHSSGD